MTAKTAETTKPGQRIANERLSDARKQNMSIATAMGAATMPVGLHKQASNIAVTHQISAARECDSFDDVR